MNFKDFLLNENRVVLGQRIGDILNALQDLDENGKSMGTRQLSRGAENVVNQIRKVLHTNWSKKQEHTLKGLQKAGVAIMKAIDEKGDLSGAISSSMAELQKLSGKLGTPLNSLASPEGGDDQADTDGQGTQHQGMAPTQSPKKAPPKAPKEQPLQPNDLPQTDNGQNQTVMASSG